MKKRTEKEFLEKVRAFSRAHTLFEPGDRVILGCSGGPDSVALLHVLLALSGELGIGRIHAVHVHHGIRGENADRDASFVRETCEKLGVPFTLCMADAKQEADANGLSLEEAARNVRFRAFERVRAEILQGDPSPVKIALAHHMNDQAETVLFRMIRGSGLKGLSGMEPLRDGIYVRPFLAVSREEILDFLTSRGILWVHDETNDHTDPSRNRIRIQAIPALEAVRPDAVQKIAETGAYLREADAYFLSEAREWIHREASVRYGEKDDARPEEIVLPSDGFGALPHILQDYITAESLRMLGVPMKDIGRVQLQAVSSLAVRRVGKYTEIRDGIRCVRTYDSIRIGQRERPVLPKCADLTLEMRTFPGNSTQIIPQKEYTKWFDYDTIKDTVLLRTRKAGDRFSTAPGTHCRLKDFLINMKIPKEDRDTLPLLASGQDVLWVVGVRMSEAHKITEQTKTVLEITVKGAGDER